jgi:hypothetical protein
MILLFPSVHRVMRAEGALRRAAVPYELIPTPKEHSAECGMCLRAEGARLADVRAALAGMEFQEIGEPEGGGPR